MKSIFIVIGVIFLLSGCAGFPKETLNLSNGDSKQDILKYYGAPKNQQFHGKYEAWQYCIRGTDFGISSFRTIWLYKGKVVGVTSYDKNGNCNFDPIKWEEAPDYTIEVRNR